MSDVVRVSACRLCDSPDLALVVAFTPTPPGDQYLTEPKAQTCYPLDVLCCRACGAVQLADTVDPALIYPEYLYTTSVSKGLDRHFEAYADEVLKRVCDLRPFVVDIGSNDGTLLRALQVRGFEVLGIEPSKAIAEQADGAGIPTTWAWFSWGLAKYLSVKHAGKADLITANHVMANVADLHDFVCGVKELLDQDGTFVFETGYWPAIVDGNLIDTIEHEHIHYFAVAPLQKLFRRHGLELVSVETNQAKGGSLRGFVQHVGAQPDATVAKFIRDEEAGGYADLDLLDGWVDQLKGIDRALHAHIAEAKANGETWVGYGAAVGSTLLLHQFGLGDFLTCLVDANPNKQGRVSPGFHLPVYAPEKLAELKPDKIVILAWRYAALIQQQHPEFAGKWLLPLPEMVNV